jgi:hypothetical protein
MVLALAALFPPRFTFAADQERFWYVNASTGDDSHDGHRPSQAKATLTAAVADSAPGDTFYIAPGTYAAANPKSGQHWMGSGWETVLEHDAMLCGAVHLTGVSAVTLENLKIQNTNPKSGQGLSAMNVEACVLRRLWILGAIDGARLDGFHHGIIDQCQATSNYDAWVVNGRCVTVKNTLGVSLAKGGQNMACFKTSLPTLNHEVHVTYVNCQALSDRTIGSADNTIGWEVDGGAVTLLENCSVFLRSSANDEPGQLIGIRATNEGICALSGSCVVRTLNEGPGGAVDLQQQGKGEIVVGQGTVRYVTTEGTITTRPPDVAANTSDTGAPAPPKPSS